MKKALSYIPFLISCPLLYLRIKLNSLTSSTEVTTIVLYYNQSLSLRPSSFLFLAMLVELTQFHDLVSYFNLTMLQKASEEEEGTSHPFSATYWDFPSRYIAFHHHQDG